ncbi:MAG: class I SAM-dependent methyltransferase [Acidobacteria bacterium]|nr:class I SAM-dependent methyltransferase [Acidobacteriota bacterium]
MSPGSRDYVVCNLCGADEGRLLFHLRELPDGRREGIVRCERCGLVYRNIRESTAVIRQRYEQEYQPEDLSASRRALFRHYIKLLDNFRRLNRLLDIGAGHGFFLRLCTERSWECYGVEISKEAVTFAKEKFNLEIFEGSLEEAHYPDDFFDVVTLWNVLDHLPDPKATLVEVHRVLRPGGGLFLRFPNGAFQIACHKFFSFLGGVWERFGSFDPSVFHLYSFDRRSIERLLKETGFVKIAVSNSVLSLNDPSEGKFSFRKRVFAQLVYGFSNLVALLSWGRWLIGPSLFVSAEKPGG